MRSRCQRSVALLLALALGGCAGTRDYDGPTSEHEHSPFVATLLAVFPGFFVHGLGNWYAGKHTRRDELLEEEGLGVGCMAIGAGLGGLGYLEHTQADKSKDTFTEVLHRMGEATSFLGAAGFTGFGLVLFFDSWIRDMAEAGDAAEARNRELRRQYESSPVVPPDAAAIESLSAGNPRTAPSRSQILADPR